ncbi:hypothetical protein LBWT_34580 [Leptolyngbya boryana IAM M-101]|nr:hypothetical protein LBWT_34580 [Leptolyngbya boryana IAM M-101]BAS63849.1 hypothetical protein LBDG_34580 [Leptolyngbya boryana dg5]
MELGLELEQLEPEFQLELREFQLELKEFRLEQLDLESQLELKEFRLELGLGLGLEQLELLALQEG